MVNTDPTRASRPQMPTGPTPGTAAARPERGIPPGEREKIGELAHEFEAFFIFQMVRQMRQSMLDGENGQGLGAGTMTDTLDVELGRQLANSGGIGLAQVLQTAIERQVGGQSRTTATGDSARIDRGGNGVAGATGSASAVASPSPVVVARETGRARDLAGARGAVQPAVHDAAVPLPVAAPLTSSFGWRTDPFHGTTRFHTGVDIGAAYGREVPAAGAGQVVFSGSQGGYGNTVVVEHPGGIRTRYAHLSSIQVETGERVQAGTVLGRVGSSGRSTGPHLHFEVLQDGHPVNPEVAATKFAGQLKLGGVVADLPHDQPSVPGVAAGVDDEDSGQ